MDKIIIVPMKCLKKFKQSAMIFLESKVKFTKITF